MLEGRLDSLEARPGTPARFALVVEAKGSGDSDSRWHSLPLNPLLGKGLRIESRNRITCLNCGVDTPRSYGDGHCYRCFSHLARCDLCVVSPVRCHYHQGTCREPQWGEAFCMQPHLVYLANSSGPKVGITSVGRQVRRWLDQGARQGLVVATAPTRHLAGVLEERLSRRVSDRTDWRALLSGEAPVQDLAVLRERLRPAPEELPPGVRWLDAEEPVTLEYPVLAYPRRLERLDLQRAGTVAGRLVGVKGQYLLFEHGVLNVRRHRAMHVHVSVLDVDGNETSYEPMPRQSQMELFP